MSEIADYRRSLARSLASAQRHTVPSTFTLGSRTWDLLPQVFAPSESPSTRTALELLGLAGDGARAGGPLLEMGCGTGVIAVSAALAGCERVVAVDINPAAVRNTAMNARRHGVADRVRTVQGDLFSSLAAVMPDERFAQVFWSSNYVLAPEGFEYRDIHQRAYVDSGYAAHRRYLAEVTHWLAPGGSALLHFSTRGDLATLLNVAGECGRALSSLGSVTVQEGEHEVEHMLLEVTVAGNRPAPARAVPEERR
ncbi:50S ribosomal protein L11 methyltransferase [Streptomyces sp.]|uniref:50S ribosomal protein L11 methyltransferase n=1 Tax=Streptomyces sp. TaxID=1931 RepID=UPI002F414019